MREKFKVRKYHRPLNPTHLSGGIRDYNCAFLALLYFAFLTRFLT